MMIRTRGSVVAVFVASVLLTTAAPAWAQECIGVNGTPLPGQGEGCSTPSPTPSPSASKKPSPSPTPTRSTTSRPSPRPTGSLVIVPSASPTPTPTPTVTPTGSSLVPIPQESTLPPYQFPTDTSIAATRPGLPIAPGDGRGFTAMVFGILAAGAAGMYALARSRVRAWMIGI